MKLYPILFLLLITSVCFAQNGSDFAHIDTAGLYLSPIKIILYNIQPASAGNNKSLRIVFKNTSKKMATAVRFHWVGQNAAGKSTPLGDGDITDKFKPGKSGIITLNLFNDDAKKILVAYAYKASFEDGTVWNLSKEWVPGWRFPFDGSIHYAKQDQ